MSTYHLHTALEHTSTTSPTKLVAICVRQGGEHTPKTAHAHLVSTSRGQFAVVRIPADALLVNEPTHTADYISDTGVHHYDFPDHEAALAFLRHLYAIAAPAPAAAAHPVSQLPETSDAFADVNVAYIVACVRHHFGPASHRLTGFSELSRSVPAPLARDVAAPPLPRPHDAATDRATFFDAALYPHPDRHPRTPS